MKKSQKKSKITKKIKKSLTKLKKSKYPRPAQVFDVP